MFMVQVNEADTWHSEPLDTLLDVAALKKAWRQLGVTAYEVR